MAGREVAGRLANVDPAAVKHAAVFAVFHHDVHGVAVLIQKNAAGRPAGKGLDAQLAAASVQVQHPGAGQIKLDDAEHGLLDLIEGGAGHVGAGQCFQPSAPGFSCNYAHVWPPLKLLFS